MFPAHCDTLKKYEQKFLSLSPECMCVRVGVCRERERDEVNDYSILRTLTSSSSLVLLNILSFPFPGT